MAYHSEIKSNELLMRSTTWMKLQRITLSGEKSQSQKITYSVIPFI